MKILNFFAIMASFGFLTTSFGCEKADLQKSSPNDSVKIETRGDCDDCPGANECCCVIQYLSGDGGTFSLCGTTDGDAVSCEIDPSPCENEINGLQHSSFTLNSTFPIQQFCVDENSAFQVRRFLIPGGNTNVRISCQRGLISPQWIYETFTDEDRSSYDTNGSCELDGPCGG